MKVYTINKLVTVNYFASLCMMLSILVKESHFSQVCFKILIDDVMIMMSYA